MRYTYKNGYTLCGMVMLASEIWKQWILTFTLNHGSYNWWYFPFQLCSIPMYVCLAIGICSSSRIRKQSSYLRSHGDRICSLLMAFLMDFGILGGIFAFFDTSGMHYAYFPLTIHSFAWHILLIIIGCYSGLNEKADRSLKGYCFSVILYLVCCGTATLFNLVFHQYGMINMFYISPYYRMRQRVFCQIAALTGSGRAIFIYILASITGAGLFHLLWNKTFRYRNR